MSEKDDHLLLKWGTLKGWSLSKPETLELLEKYHEFGVSMSVAMQHDSPEQRQVLCDLIRAHEGSITNDWDGKEYTPEQAIEYVMNYGKDR